MLTVDEVLDGALIGDTLELAEGWKIRSRLGAEVSNFRESIGVYDEDGVSRGMFAETALNGASHGHSDGSRRNFLASMMLAMEVMPGVIDEMACGGEY